MGVKQILNVTFCKNKNNCYIKGSNGVKYSVTEQELDYIYNVYLLLKDDKLEKQQIRYIYQDKFISGSISDSLVKKLLGEVQYNFILNGLKDRKDGFNVYFSRNVTSFDLDQTIKIAME